MKIKCFEKLGIIQAVLKNFNSNSGLSVGSSLTVCLLNNLPQKIIGIIVTPV